MKEVVRADDPRLAALIARQATQAVDNEQIGLDRIIALLDSLGRPHDRLPPVFHVAGTNGKGSTCAFLRAGLEASGHRVHVFTSPHLVRYNERIRLAGTLIDDAQLADVMARVLDANDTVGGSLFEVNTAAAFLAFADTPAEAVVLEVGLGGRLDATNVIAAPLVTGIASIGLDHQHFLGDTLAEIAREKAGIARRDVPLVCLAQPVEAQAAIECVAATIGAPLKLEARDWRLDPSLVPALPGAHQIRNANLAWVMLAAQDRLPVPRAAFTHAIAAATWPARFQRLADGPLTNGIETWLDGAHNSDAAASLAALLKERAPMHVVLGILANKDAAGIVEILAPHARSLTFVPIPDHEAHDPAALSMRFNGRAAASLEQALADLPAPRLIAGSLYLAGTALTLNGERPD
ncbi:MAG: bifunctional folylpolyglutamate synthase/dihydrofolate synthase [Sphingomonas bacterium]|nr:bifunctional folylpolyglutamate synthase/dihydrofolate synthase [Sphingomonas bacterium]